MEKIHVLFFKLIIFTFDVHNTGTICLLHPRPKPKQRARERVKVGSKMDEKDIFFK